ncbi:transglycosylase domain-containing protein [Lapidilactobacillus achengensis]|uniref:Transglycosylase domain-containing protein n=1 Tax=Lapidilactobacillus achengensis TaxID=2486000 RepID=A0ABW1UKY4_9LACO|nr:transglycosylase domain-containing protein [Lapidilactobacillus achengensis]
MNEPQNWWQNLLEQIKLYSRRLGAFLKKQGIALSAFLRKKFGQINFSRDWRFNVDVGLQTLRRLVLYFMSFLFILGALVLGLGLGYFSGLMSHEKVPSYNSMKRQIENINQSSELYFAKDVKLASVKSDLIRTQTKSGQISANLKKAIVATEDEDYYNHAGVVPKSLVRAVLADVTGLGTQTGGSTLTQQLVKMQLLSSETTWRRKAVEIMLALRIDKYFSKDQILESYLNVATFGRNNAGQNIAGVETAAQGLFGTSAAKLSLAQAAFIAGLPQSPSIYTPYRQDGTVKKDLTYSMKRKDVVLFRMYRHGDITKKAYEDAKKVDLRSQFQKPTTASTSTTKYGYMYNLLMSEAREILIKQLIKQNGRSVSKVEKDTQLYNRYWESADELLKQKGYRIDSTVNKDLYDQLESVTKTASVNFGQTYTETAYDDNLKKEVTITEKVQPGSVVLDNSTGAVLAFVGGQDFNENQINHAFSTKRSPGSSIKPLMIYGPAIENQVINSQTALADFPRAFGNYKPSDYGSTIQNRFVPTTEALEWSYNLPAVNLYYHLRNNTRVDVSTYMKKMGLDLTTDEYSQLGLALGGTKEGFTVEQNAAAFATFANQGSYLKPYVINKITAPNGSVIYQHKTKKTKVFSASTSYIMQEMLKKVVSAGTAANLSWQLNFNTSNVYGKTGTTNDYRDNWFVGSTPGITMATWLGYDNFYGNVHNLSSNASTINTTYWAQLANAIYQQDASLLKLNQTTSKPDNVQTHTVLANTGTNSGTVSYQGQSIAVTGNRVSALFNNHGPSNISAQFGIGGTAADYKLFFDYLQGIKNNYGVILHLDANGDVIESSTSTTDETETEDEENEEETAGNEENEDETTDPENENGANSSSTSSSSSTANSSSNTSSSANSSSTVTPETPATP